MAIYRHTLVFEGAGHGWTESMYFWNDAEDIDLAFIQIGTVKMKRAVLLGSQFHIKGERVALVRSNTNAPITNRAELKKGFWASPKNQPGEDTGTSLQVQMMTADKQNKKLLFMGGVWAGIFPFANALDRNFGGWESEFQAWAESLVAAKMGWLTRSVSQSAKITGYTFDDATGMTSLVLGGAGIVWPDGNPPTRVSVEFPLRRHPLDGSYLVVPDGPNGCITAAPRPAPPFQVDGDLKIYGYNLVRLDTLHQQKVGTVTGQNPVSRKRGAPLLVSRGRAPVQVRW